MYVDDPRLPYVSNATGMGWDQSETEIPCERVSIAHREKNCAETYCIAWDISGLFI